MRVVIVASDAAAAETIRRAMRYAPSCRVMGWLDARQPCAAPLIELLPDIVVIDGGTDSRAALAVARSIRGAVESAKVVLLTDQPAPELLAAAERAGIDAAIAKSASPASVGMLVREVASGHVFHFAPAPVLPSQPQTTAASDLTTRELEILRHVSAGLSNGRIAAELWVTEQTVKFHLSNVYRKLGLQNRTEAAHYAYRNGLAGAHPDHAELPVAA